MVIVFANNQHMSADGSTGATSSIFTDPVPLNGNDRATLVLNAHYFFGGGGAANRTFSVITQVSNDGVVFVNVGAPVTITATSDTPKPDTRSVNGAYLRYNYQLTGQNGAPNAEICFDLHVNLDHV